MADVLTNTSGKVTASGTAYTRRTYTIDGGADPAVTYVRNDNDPAVAAHVVIFYHGVGGDEYNFDNSRNTTHRDALMDAGYIVVAARGALKNWGNQAGLDAYLAAYGLVTRLYTPGRLVTYGQSMGGLLGLLTTLDTRFPEPAGHFGVSPACGLKASWDDGYTTDIQAAYGFAGSTFDETATAGHDPLLDYLTTDYPAGCHFLFVASPDDTSITKAWHSDAMATKLRGWAAEVNVRQATGGHLSADDYDPVELMAFYTRAVTDSPGGDIVTATPAGEFLRFDGRDVPCERFARVEGRDYPVGHSIFHT